MDVATPRDLRGRFASDQGAVVKAHRMESGGKWSLVNVDAGAKWGSLMAIRFPLAPHCVS